MDHNVPVVSHDDFEEVSQAIGDLVKCRMILKEIFSRFALKTRDFNEEYMHLEKIKTMVEANDGISQYQEDYEKLMKGWNEYLELKSVLKINDKEHCETLKEEDKLAKILEKLDGLSIRKKK